MYDIYAYKSSAACDQVKRLGRLYAHQREMQELKRKQTIRNMVVVCSIIAISCFYLI